MFVSDRMEKELKEVSEELVGKREILVLLVSLALGSLVGASLKLPYLAGAGAAALFSAWYLYGNVLKKKLELLEEAWGLLISVKGLEAKAIHEPEKRKEYEEMISVKEKQFKKVIWVMKETNKELNEELDKAFALYGLGAGLLASSLAFELPWPFDAVSYVLFLSVLLLPIPTMVAHLRSPRPRR